MKLPNENEVWYMLQSYYSRYGFVRHQIESFNAFITTLLPHIIQESSELRVTQDDEEHIVSLCNMSVDRPTKTDVDGSEVPLTPQLARLCHLTYSSSVNVDVVHDIMKDGVRIERRLFREVCLCRLPIMLGSVCCHTQYNEMSMECRLDPGGYFIVSGNEKVLIAQEKLHHNTPYVFPVKQPSRYILQCEIRSCHERKLRSTSSLYIYITNSKNGATPEMVAELPFINIMVPVLGLFRLLGVNTREGAVEAILGRGETSETRILSAILDNDSTADMTTENLYDFIGKEGTREVTREKRHRYLEHIVNCEVLPHQGLSRTPEVLRAKTLFLGIMIRKLLRVYTGSLQCDDRDHISAKRYDCAGVQYGLLFRQVFRNVQKSTLMQLQRFADNKKLYYTNIGNIVAGRKLTQAFRYAMATGNWGILSTRGNTAQNGVAQQLGRMTSASTVALLRKVSTPVARETKNPAPRQLHHTAWGLLCPMDTPEGGACGLTKSFAMMAHVRVGTFSNAIREQLDLMQSNVLQKALESSSEFRCNGIPVLINGCLYMYVKDVASCSKLMQQLRKLRQYQTLPFDTTIAHVDGHLHIDSDPGCLMRPLIRVDKLEAFKEVIQTAPSHEFIMESMITKNVIEYVDKQEEASLRVALSPFQTPAEGWKSFTHCELHPCLIAGLSGSLIPFPEFNQSPRNTYQSAMMKQALGVFALNHPVRMDTIAHNMVAPQKPMTTTRMDSLIGASDAPAGINAIVAIMCYTGQNQEDSLIMNRKFLELGAFRSVKLQTYRDEERQNGGTDAERFENVGKLNNVAGKRDANYERLDDQGIVNVGTNVSQNDVLISKTVTTTELGEGARKAVKRDKSTIMRHDEGIVDAVLTVTNHDGTRMCKVRVRKTRTPIVGDKFSSRMGQKGVIGAILDPEDMPYTEDGVVPDIIVNPHAIPSRMTIGQLAECLLNILCIQEGTRGDGTMFRETSIEYLCKQLEKAGYDRFGRTKLYNGFSGEAYQSLIFMGPTYYQRLRHMAQDKDHGRGRGPVHMLSRQPTEGRSRDGGLRFGEMERDALISHGASYMLMDRLLDNSDPSTLAICGKCGLLALPKAENTHVRHKQAFCKNCGESSNIKEMCSPVAFRLMLQELQAMHIGVRFMFNESQDDSATSQISQ